MAKINCKMCGGKFNLQEGITAGKCPYCGTTTTFPQISTEHHEQLHNWEEDFLRRNNLDKADVKEKTTSDSDEIAGCFGFVAIIVVVGLILYALYKLFIECDCFLCRLFR